MKCFYFFVFSLFFSSIIAQNKLPIIRANSSIVAINDGGHFEKNAWSLSPEAKPDVYVADRSAKSKWVTFYTDIDSIKVKINPYSIFDFIILLKEKDSCYTRIVGSKTIRNSTFKSVNTCDTIPFELNKYDAIHVINTLQNGDTIHLHFDLGTLDFRITKEAMTRLKTKEFKTMRMGTLLFENIEFKTAVNASHDMDGRFGWRIFDDKIIEINYDINKIFVHSVLPKKRRGFVKSNIHFAQSLFCIYSTIKIDHKKYSGKFLFDTGSDLAMVLDSVWMRHQNFPNDQKIINRSSFSDGAGKRYETSTVITPQVNINGFEIVDIPTSKLHYASPVGSEINYFGNKVLKRFNILIDLKNDMLYLKPNHLYHEPFSM